MTRRQREQAERKELERLYASTPNHKLALKFNTTVQAIKNRAQRYGLKKDPRVTLGTDNTGEPEMAKRTLKKAREAHKQRELGRYNERNYREALAYIEELEMQVKAIETLQNNSRTHTIKPVKKRGKDEAIVVACLTDVHIGEEVLPEQVQGLNEYNMDIARRRVDEFFSKIVRLTEKERQDVHISELILFMGGDIIDGALHLDTIMSNEVTEPMKQAVSAQSWIESGLLHLEPHFDKITIVCKDGNHGRVTHRLHASSRQGNSLEWYMFHNLAARLPQFNWVNDLALHTYITLYKGHPGERTLRFHHGDTISFGGVNGPYTYLNRRAMQWNKANVAKGSPVIDVIGHLHMYRVNPAGWVLNGSVVGYNSFATKIGAEFERPCQALFLIDKDRGMTVNIPIIFSC